MVYQMKVYRLPLGTPQARGKAMVNLLPLEEGEWIQTVMPMPVDEDMGRFTGYVRHIGRHSAAECAFRFHKY